MKGFLTEVYDRLRETGLPVYAAGTVPAGAPLPRLVWEASFEGAACTVTAEVWHTGAAEESAAWADRLTALFPPGGLRLTGGRGMLRGKSAAFLRQEGIGGVRVILTGLALREAKEVRPCGG